MFTLPQFPETRLGPASLTSKQGVFYSQKVLRAIDGAFPELETRSKALEYAIQQVTLAARAEPSASTFTTSVLSGLIGARSTLSAHVARAAGQCGEAVRARKRAAEELDRLNASAAVKRAHAESLRAQAATADLKAQSLEEQARAAHERLMSYADKLESDASRAESVSLHDRRFI